MLGLLKKKQNHFIIGYWIKMKPQMRKMVDFRPAMALCVGGIFTRYEQSWASLHIFPFAIFPRGVDNERFWLSAGFCGNESVLKVMSIQRNHKYEKSI